MPDPVLLVGALVIVVGIAFLVVLARDNHTFSMSEKLPRLDARATDAAIIRQEREQERRAVGR